MSGLFLINVLDVARALGMQPFSATPEMVATWLLNEYLRKRGGGFNYNPAIAVTFELFRGGMTYDQAVLHCMTNGNPKGRRQNAEAVKSVAQYALDNISTCYRLSATAVAIGRTNGQTVYVAFKAPLVRVVHDEAFVVMPGYRMSHRPVEAEIDVACSMGLANFARDDFANADFEYLYAGPGVAGIRDFRSIKGRERSVLSRDAVDHLLDVYLKGVALAIEAGAEAKEPNLRGYNVYDPRDRTLF